MESAMLFLDDFLLTPGARPAVFTDGAGIQVLPGSPSPRGSWSLGDQYNLSPRDELIQQDSLWSDPSGVLGSPAADVVFGDVQYEDGAGSEGGKPSPHFWCDEEFLPLPTSYKPLHPTSLLLDEITSAHSSLPHSSPMDVKFELGDVFEFSSLVADQIGYFDAGTTFQSIDFYSSNVTADKPVFQLGQYDMDASTDGAVPSSPLGDYEIILDDSDSQVSDTANDAKFSLSADDTDTLGLDDDDSDSLHEAELVCQLLRELGEPSVVQSSSAALSHVSAEEVDSVLSRDSSRENLAALDKPACQSLQKPMQQPASQTIAAFDRPIQLSLTSVARPAVVLQTSAIVTPVISLPCSIAGPVRPMSLGSGYEHAGLITKLTSSGPASAHPYCAGDVLSERKMRKKEQNKTAALRYRQKKREEKGHSTTEVEELEQKNNALRHRADELSREISYLKGLLEEIKRQ